MKFKITESIDWDTVQYGVHQFSTESIIFRGTEEECIKYIDERPELWDDAEVYFMTPDDPHYQRNESLEEDMKYYPQDYDKIDLEYMKLDLGDEVIDWTYEVDKEALYTFIFESCLTEEDFPAAFEDDFDPNNEEDWKLFTAWLEDNFDEIFSKYQDKILDNWEEEAIEDAQENYNHEDYVDWDSMPGGHDDYRFDEAMLNEDLNKEFVELEAFKNSWKDLRLTDEDLRDLQNEILTQRNKWIPLGSDVYKIYFAPKSWNKGSRESLRAIYIELIRKDQIYLAYAFNKADEANITNKELDLFRTVANSMNKEEKNR